jgi:hypothetical protein
VISTYKRVVLAFIAFLAKNHVLMLKGGNIAFLRKFIKYQKTRSKNNLAVLQLHVAIGCLY